MDINDAKNVENVEPNSCSCKQKQKEAQEVDQTVVGAKVKEKRGLRALLLLF